MATTAITTDSRNRVVLPGAEPGQQYLVETYEDGTMLLQPAVTITKAQLEYNTTPELQALLTEAATSQTVHRTRRAR